MEQKNNWERYYENTKERPPRKELVEAIKFIDKKDSALDMGAGALQDSEYLLQEGFSKVVALDSEPTLKKLSEQIHNEKLHVVVSSFERFDFPEETFDIVSAQYSLLFIQPQEFKRVFESIKDSLAERGIFVGQLFGVNDDWSQNANMTFCTKEDVVELIDDMEVIRFDEEEKDEPTASGNDKHWHIFNLILRKT